MASSSTIAMSGLGRVRRILGIVRGKIGEQLGDDPDRVGVVLGEEVHVAGDRGVHVGAADVVHRHRLARHRLDHLRAGDEHVGVLPGHHDKVHERRRIGGAARTRAADHGDLRHHARQEDVHVEDVAVTGQRVDTFLDAGAGGILEGDDRRAELGGLLHQRDDLFGVHLAERSADNREILAERRDDASADVTRARHDPVGRQVLVLHAEEAGGMVDVGPELLEGVVLKQRVEPVARAHEPLRAPLRELVRAAAGQDGPPALAQVLKQLQRKRHLVTVCLNVGCREGRRQRNARSGGRSPTSCGVGVSTTAASSSLRRPPPVLKAEL